MTRVIALSVLGLFALASVAAGVAAAQTTAPPPTTTTTPTSAEDSASGAYDQLSAGNRKVARALFEGQKDTAPSATTLSLDDIAARKQNGEGWGVIFKDMKSQGLVDAKNLGELVSRSSRGHGHAGVVTTASGRTLSDGSHGQGSKGPKRLDADAGVSARSNSGHGGGFAHGGGSGYGGGSSHGGSGHGQSGGMGHGRGK